MLFSPFDFLCALDGGRGGGWMWGRRCFNFLLDCAMVIFDFDFWLAILFFGAVAATLSDKQSVAIFAQHL